MKTMYNSNSKTRFISDMRFLYQKIDIWYGDVYYNSLRESLQKGNIIPLLYFIEENREYFSQFTNAIFRGRYSRCINAILNMMITPHIDNVSHIGCRIENTERTERIGKAVLLPVYIIENDIIIGKTNEFNSYVKYGDVYVSNNGNSIRFLS